jgi:hypothetical protein
MIPDKQETVGAMHTAYNGNFIRGAFELRRGRVDQFEARKTEDHPARESRQPYSCPYNYPNGSHEFPSRAAPEPNRVSGLGFRVSGEEKDKRK